MHGWAEARNNKEIWIHGSQRELGMAFALGLSFNHSGQEQEAKSEVWV